jgi:hypothetical protein
MQRRIRQKISQFFEVIQSKYAMNRSFILLSIFLLVVLLVSFIIPILHFGRFFGTDDYLHLFHTNEMESSQGLSDFYERMGAHVSNPNSGENDYNYPFGLWLFGATIAKITGLSSLNAEFIFVIIFLFILIGSFYLYSGTFLELKEQKILAVLFLISMPSASIDILSYRPSIFILPFLFILFYIALKEPFQWKFLPIAWLSIFMIILSHTGTLIFLIIFSILFFLLYCLLWGKLSLSMYIVIVSTFVIYIFSLTWFPEIANQYDVKSTLLLSPGNFFASKFNFSLPLELGNIFYQNMLVNQEIIYAIIFGACIFALGKFFLFFHQKVSEKYSQLKHFYPFALPISNISHSFTAAPLWVGPLHVILSFIGFFRIDGKGKCMLITALFVTILPDMLLTAQGTLTATGVTREISYIVLIIPITTVLGLWAIFSYIETRKQSQQKIITLMVWIIILLAIIVPPTLATTYYLPKISGENYVVDGMKWLGENGENNEKVVGYGLKTVPIYTNMTDAGYGIQDGSEMTTFLMSLKGIYFSSSGNDVDNLRHYFGVKYILLSDKLIANLGGKNSDLKIDNNPAMDKIYSNKDFGIYDITVSSENPGMKKFIADNISFQQTGSSIQIGTEVYKVVLNADFPIIEQFGSPTDNYLGDGFLNDYIQISGLQKNSSTNPFIPFDPSDIQNSTVDKFLLSDVHASHEITGNQIIYRCILTDQQNHHNEASLIVQYTFYPKTIKREFIISNDWVSSPIASKMNVLYRTNMFLPMNDFIIKKDQTRIKRHIYTSLDGIVLNEIFHDIYVYNGNRGIYIKNEQTAPYPNELYYMGSTLYNRGVLQFTQEDSIKPGSSFHVTQFLSIGDEASAEKNILSQEGISLLDYPNGIIPIIISGDPGTYSDYGAVENIKQGYQLLHDENIPYSDVMELSTNMENLVIPVNSSNSLIISTQIPNKSGLQNFTNNGKSIIGSGSTGSYYFDNLSTQEQSISSLIGVSQEKSLTLIGYMPSYLNYNLDTLKIVSDKKIPFIFFDYIHPPYYGIFGQENRNPQVAIYNNHPLNVVLFPISYPMSSDLSSKTDNSKIFDGWRAAIDESSSNDKMILFIYNTEDIGNPDYSEDFKRLIEYAKNNNLTFTTPDVISNHIKNIQNIQYSGSISGDQATIHITNNNDEIVQGVSFRVRLPVLKNGVYKVSDGLIVKTKLDNETMFVYISTDILAHTTKNIIIEPEGSKEMIFVTIPRQPVEGITTISIKDIKGNSLKNADVIIDSKYYQPDANGNVQIDLKRGIHTIEILCPGFESYSSKINVKGRIYLIGQFFGIFS